MAACVLLAATMLAMAVAWGRNMVDGVTTQRSIESYQTQTATLVKENEMMQQQLTAAESGDRIRNRAQNELGMLRRERAQTETIYIQAPEKKAQDEAQALSENHMEILDFLLGKLAQRVSYWRDERALRSPGATVRKRLVLLMGGFFLLFLCVCVRLVDLQIVRQKELTARGVKQWTRSGVVSARRGDIVDTNRQAAGAVCDQLYFDREAAGREECERAGGRARAGTGTQRRNDHQKTVGQQRGFRDAGQADLTGGRRPASRHPAAAPENPGISDALIGITFDEDVSRWYPMGTLLAQVLGLCNVDGEGQSGLELKLQR